MVYIAPHAKWLEPYLNLEEGMIQLTHNTTENRIEKIRKEGLRIPQGDFPKNWGSGDGDLGAIFAYVPNDKSLSPRGTSINVPIKFKYPISKVYVRPPLISHEPEKYRVKREGMPLEEYLKKEPPEVWNTVTCVEFLILEDISPEKLLFD